jgi:hypothetical protein
MLMLNSGLVAFDCSCKLLNGFLQDDIILCCFQIFVARSERSKWSSGQGAEEHLCGLFSSSHQITATQLLHQQVECLQSSTLRFLELCSRFDYLLFPLHFSAKYSIK